MREAIRVNYQGKQVTFKQLGALLGVNPDTLYSRYKNGLVITTAEYLPRGSKTPTKGDTKMCTSCNEFKTKDCFKAAPTGLWGVHSKCRDCLNYQASQRKYFKMLEAGDRSVVECAKCEAFMKKSASTNLCLRCRKELKNESNDKKITVGA